MDVLPHHCMWLCVCVSRCVLEASVSSSSQDCSSSIHVFVWNGTGPKPVGMSLRGLCCWLLYAVFGMSRLSCQKSKGLGWGSLEPEQFQIVENFVWLPLSSARWCVLGWGLDSEGRKEKEMHNFLSSVPVDWSFPN